MVVKTIKETEIRKFVLKLPNTKQSMSRT